MEQREYRTINQDNAQVRMVERPDRPPILKGYASVYNVPSPVLRDRMGRPFREIILPGAFDKSLARAEDVLSTINHDMREILAKRSNKRLTVGSDDVGLWFEVELDPSVTYVRDLLANIRNGNISGASIIFKPTKQKMRKAREEEDGVEVRAVAEAELFELGPVTNPVYVETSVDIRSLDCQEEPECDKPILAETLEQLREMGIELRSMVAGLRGQSEE